ncbi:TonB-dependent receptor [Stutzerimonas azotifigens]|uniref:TonB-dependent receptor n=1 Tax=Stutzerimonas azotifigens TaxID=291995 RepID=UPI0004163B00|nr:TonB-dependent receptor [Stutzerimonas azotifigens]
MSRYFTQPRLRLVPPCLLGAALFVPAALAATADSALSLGASTITGTAAGASGGTLATGSVLSSVDLLGAELLEQQPVLYSWELFRRAPGVMLTEFGQGTTSGKLSFRAFNGEGEVNAVKLLIDGIPSNSNDGNMPYLDMLFPLELDGVEVVRGTNDPRYGLYNIAGNVNLQSRIGGDYGRLRLRYGSHDTQELQLAKGIQGSQWSQNYFIGQQKSDGYRDHAGSQRTSLSGKWFFTPDDGDWRLGLIARHYQGEADEPGYLSREAARHSPTRASPLSATDTGERRMNQLSLHLDSRLSETLAWSSKAWLNTLDDDRWVRFSAATPQQRRTAEERHYGARTALTYRPAQRWLYDLALEGGLDTEQQRNRSERYTTEARQPIARTRDQRFDYDSYGAYLQAVIQPVESLKVIPAYRVDRIDGDFSDRLIGEDYAINDYGTIEQPKIGLVYTPVSQLSLYGNWGRAFQIGTGAAAYKVPPRSADLSPSINDGWEVGLKFAPAHWLDGRVAYWEQEASDEVRRRLNDPSGESENLGRTRRWGYDAQLNLYPRDRLALWLAHSWQFSEIEEPDPSLPASRGKEIDHVPQRLYSAGMRYEASADLELSAWLNGQTDYHLERENRVGRYGGYVLLNLGANYRITPQLALDLQLKNLADRYYEYVWYDGVETLHAPGEGRALYAGLTLDF